MLDDALSGISPELFLVATTEHLLGLDSTARCRLVHSGAGLYYGLAQDDRHVYVACRHETVGHDDASSRAQQTGSILVLDITSLEVVDEIEPPFPLRDVHGMSCFDGCLWVTCSYDNMVAVFDLDLRSWERWYPAVDTRAQGSDVNHFNSIAPIDDGRVVVVAHNNGLSHLQVHDRRSLELLSVAPLGNQAHDVFFVDGSIGTCSSGDGQLISAAGWQLRTGGFPRGVAYGTDRTLVGVSPRASRTERHMQSPLVRVFTRSWVRVADVVLPGAGMVLAIARMPARTRPVGLPAWPNAVVSAVRGSPIRDGDAYDVADGACSALVASEWHEAREAHRWTAARHARMAIVVNPGDTTLAVSATSHYPGAYGATLHLDGRLVGEIGWARPAARHERFSLPEGVAGQVELTISVPHLWRRSDRLAYSSDDRVVGIGIARIALEQRR